MLLILFLCCLCIQITPGCLRVWVFGLRFCVSWSLVCKYWYELYNSCHKLSRHEQSQKPASLADFQLFPCQKLYFGSDCSTCGLFNLVILPKIAGKKFSHYFTAWADAMWESQQGRKWRMHRADWGNVCFRDSPQSPDRSCVCVGGSQRFVVSAIYPGTRLPGYQCAATRWHVRQTCSVCVSYFYLVMLPSCCSFIRADRTPGNR